MKILNNKYIESIIFSLASAFGLLLSIEILNNYGEKLFLFINFIVCLVILIEIYINWRISVRVLKQLHMTIQNSYNVLGHFFNHLVTPLLFYLSSAYFIYFNEDPILNLVTIIILFFIFFVFFVNIKSYYKDDFKEELKTNYIYDALKLFIYFYSINIVLSFSQLNNFSIQIVGILIFLISFIIGIFITAKEIFFNFSAKLYFLFGSFFISIVFFVLSFFNFIELGINFILFLFFYFILSLFHHRTERTLTIEIIVQYILFFLLSLVLFWGIS